MAIVTVHAFLKGVAVTDNQLSNSSFTNNASWFSGYAIQ